MKIKTIEDLKQFLKEYLRDKKVKVYLFGSRARGDFSYSSDIDLAFEIEDEINLSEIRYILEESNLPYKVDIVDLRFAPYLREVVLKEGVRWV